MQDEQEDPYAGVKRLRKFLIVLLVIFCLVSFAYSMVTLNFLRQPLEEKFGGALKVQGDIKLGMDGFHPTIVAHDITYNAIKLKKAETRVPFAQPKPGKPVETRVVLTALTLPGRPPIDIDLPMKSDTLDSSITNLQIRAGDSKLTGGLSYNHGDFKALITATRLDYGLLYPGASGGAAEGTFISRGFGARPREIVASLNGNLTLKGGKGKIPGRALAFWNGDLLGALFTSEADVYCAQVEFDMKNGIATAKKIILETSNLYITGSGKIDFAQGRMDMVFLPFAGDSNVAGVPLQVSGYFGEVTVAPMEAMTLEMPLRGLPCIGAKP